MFKRSMIACSVLSVLMVLDTVAETSPPEVLVPVYVIGQKATASSAGKMEGYQAIG